MYIHILDLTRESNISNIMFMYYLNIQGSSFRGELFDKQKVSKQCTMRIFNENQTMSCHARRVVMDGVTRAVVT